MNASEIIGFFSLGLISSLHCLGMCSPIVLAYSSHFTLSEKPISPRVSTATHLLYNFGRITTYAFLGGFCGVVGKSLNLSLIAVGIGASHRVVPLISGVAVILFGLMQLGVLARWSILSENIFFSSNLFQESVGRVIVSPSLTAKYVMGVLLGFLPCILTYSMFVTAVSSGGFVKGFVMLLVFGFGTVPMLFLTGLFSGAILRLLRRYGNLISGLAMLLLGALLLMSAFFDLRHA